MDFPGRNILFVVVVGLLVVPLQATLIPILKLFATWGIAGTFLAAWLAHGRIVLLPVVACQPTPVRSAVA